ncbi:MAG TPA: EVE domain-containing protein [Candidatus Binatia bacterium]|jgi:predicted RNA-binding protein with PUA-like domain
MACWIAKSEPSTYSWEQLVHDKKTRWDGIRNAQARNNLAAMKKGDDVLIYHSGDDKAVVGIATVARAAYQDPTIDDERWLCVDLAAKKPLPSPVTLATIKSTPALKQIGLVRQGRLSVVPITDAEMRTIVALAKK